MSFSQGATVKRIHKNRFGCELCNITFVEKNLLREHLAGLHLDPFLYKCSRCDYFNKCRSSIQIHLETEHGGDREAKVVKNDIVCELCSMRFPFMSELENHVRQRHSAELQCPACEEDKYFLTKKALKSHFIFKHGESLWGSYVRSTYKEAYHRVHKLKVDPHTGEHCCYICNRNSSANRIKLFRHVTGHLDLYPYCCPECPYMSEVRFKVTRHYLRNHPKSKSMHKIVNRFARWDHKLKITALKNYWQQDTLTQNSSGFKGKILPMLNNAKRVKEVTLPSNPIETTIYVEIYRGNSLCREGEGESGDKRSTDQSYLVCSFCDSSFVSKPQLQQHISSLHTCHSKGELNQSEISSQHTTVQILAHREPSEGKYSKLDLGELSDGEVHFVERKRTEVIPEKNESKKAKLDMTEYDRKEPHDTKFACSCYLCDSQFTSYIEFYTHSLDHENQAAYRCSTCSHASIGLIQIRRHVKLKHETQGKLSIQLVPVDLSCKTCEDLRANKEELQTHVSRVHDVGLHCSLCQKLFGDVMLLREHFVLEHGTVQWTSSVHAVCEKLKEKVRYLKPNSSHRLICLYCDATFGDKCVLFTHLRVVHLRLKTETLALDINHETSFKKKVRGSFYCYICPNIFTTKARFMKHLHKHRDISLPHFCKSCGAFIAHRNCMEVHWYENHGKSEVRYTRIPRSVYPRLSFISNFPCRYCNIYQKTETHRMRHESEKHAENFKCSGCNFACEKIDMMKIHITVVHAKSVPKPSMLRRKLCPVSTSSDVLVISQVQNQEKEAILTPNLLANNHGIKSSSIKMETDGTNLLNFEAAKCTPILQETRTKKDFLELSHLNLGSGLKGAATLVRQDQNLLSVLQSCGLNSQPTGSNSSPEWGGTKISRSSSTSASHSVKSGTEMGDLDEMNNTILLSSTCAEASNCGNVYNTANQFFNIKEEMEFEDIVIKEESLDREDSNSTEVAIVDPITSFQDQALPNVMEVNSFKTEDLDLKEEHAQWEALPGTTELSSAITEEQILHHQSHALPARTGSRISPQEELVITEAELRVRETVKDFYYQAYPCYLCQKMVSTQFQLIRHVVDAHLKVRPYECAYCARQCFREHDVRTHCAREHPGLPAQVLTRFQLDMFLRKCDVSVECRRPVKKRRRGELQSRNVDKQTESSGDMSLDGKAVREIHNSPASKIMDLNTSHCTTTDVIEAKVKAVPIPGTSHTRRVTSRPYPDSLPPVPGGCLPCSVQL